MSSAERVWLITGCSAGFGRRLVYSALARGDKVIATARSLSKIEDLSENPFVEDKADNLRLLALDVTAGFAVIKEILDKANKIWGRIDVLVNNAGYGVPATIEEGGELARIRPRRLLSMVIHRCPFLPICEADANYPTALTETLTFELAQFNIKVLLVAPGAFKTEGAYNYPWDNPNPLPAYDNIRTASLEKLGSIRDAIKGDPQKAMEVVVDVVRGEGVAKGREWPTYLILGEDAEVDIRNKIGKIAKALDDWQDVIRSEYPSFPVWVERRNPARGLIGRQPITFLRTTISALTELSPGFFRFASCNRTAMDVHSIITIDLVCYLLVLAFLCLNKA
ncbi:oxidoreductase YusZ [Salix suchowensis]|nr:oxidoreductase YusZ [Salix suchowensis]